jgi:hypothetical protein
MHDALVTDETAAHVSTLTLRGAHGGALPYIAGES